jgi:outer membrane murein-binding lipoprotein Lpp
VKLQQLVSSVAALSMDSQQMQAVTAELSSDVKQTVDTIREAEKQGAPADSSST